MFEKLRFLKIFSNEFFFYFSRQFKYLNPLRTKGGSNLTPPLKNGFSNLRFFHVFKRNLEKKLNLNINTIHILHLVCFLCILELHQLNYDWVSKHSENHQKRPGSERVNSGHVLGPRCDFASFWRCAPENARRQQLSGKSWAGHKVPSSNWISKTNPL